MGFSLRNLVKGVAADINLFDHGASQATVNRPQAKPAPRPSPASTAPVQSNPLQVRQVQRPTFMPSVQPVQAPKPLNVGVVHPQPLHVGNAVITQSPAAHTQAPIKQQPHASIAHDLTHNPFTNFLGNPPKSIVQGVSSSPFANVLKVDAAGLTHNQKALDKAVPQLKSSLGIGTPKLAVSSKNKQGKIVPNPEFAKQAFNLSQGFGETAGAKGESPTPKPTSKLVASEPKATAPTTKLVSTNTAAGAASKPTEQLSNGAVPTKVPLEAKAVSSKPTIPPEVQAQTVYHGGAGVDEITKNGVKILSPEEKLKYPSSGGGYIGLSTSADKNYAQQFSQNIAGHNRVAEIKINPKARILDLPDGKAIDDMSANELATLSKKYDVIKSTEDNEYRILNEKGVAPQPTQAAKQPPILGTPIKRSEQSGLALSNPPTGQVIQKGVKLSPDEMSLYPNGKYRQVKITGKPAQMSDAELQSLSQTPEGQLPKQTNKVIERNDKKVLRNADAERQVVDVLKKGGTSDEALNAYMKATGADLQTAVHDVRRVAGESKLGFEGGKNPLLGTVKLPEVQAGDHNQAFLNADFVKQHEQAIGQQALDAFHGLSEHDKTLLKSIETNTVSDVTKKANNPQAFLEAEKQIRTYYDTRHAYDNALGIDVGYRANYLRQLFTKAEENAKAGLPDQMNIKAGNKNPGYTHARTNDTLNTHVGEALERDIAGSSTNHAKLAYSEGLHQAYPDQINASGQLVRDDSGNYLQLTNKYGQGITANKDIAAEINSRSRSQTTSKGLQRYDKLNAGLKYVKLGGGAFHALTEAGNFIGQQLTSGKILTNPGASAKVFKTFFSPKAMDKAMGEFRTNGTLDNASLSGLKIMAKDILADANVKLGGKLSKYSGIQALHDATFQREIPYAKLKMFEQKTKGLDVNKPEDLAKMRSVSQGINDLFGGINRDIHGIKPKEFKVLQRFVLATDFTEGKIKTAFNTINITDNSPAANLARQAVLGKVLLFGGIATAGGALGGEFKGRTPKDVALAIANKLADPSFKAGRYKVALPATHVSEFSRPITPLVHPATKGSSKGDRFAGLQHYATGRLAAIPSEAYQIRTNKDYSGNKIYGKDYAFNGGEQISPGKTAANVLSGFTPIPATQGIGVGQGKTDPRAAIANTVGLRVTNEDRYNQNATPVKIGSQTLTKDKAIAYNKAVQTQRTNLDKQLQSNAVYKTASPSDQKKLTTKLHTQISDYQKRVASTQNNIPITKQANKADSALSQNRLPDVTLGKTKTAKTPKVPKAPKIPKAAKVKTPKVKVSKAKGTKKAKSYNYAKALSIPKGANQTALRSLVSKSRIKGSSRSKNLSPTKYAIKKQTITRRKAKVLA